jgi:hypothetical protein
MLAAPRYITKLRPARLVFEWGRLCNLMCCKRAVIGLA